MKKEPDVIVKNEAQIPNEVIAEAILRVSEGFDKLLKSGLNRRAILVLVKAETGIPHSYIESILDCLPKLAALYTLPKKSGKAR